VCGLSYGATLKKVEVFFHLSWYGDVHSVVDVVPCHVHGQVKLASPVGGDDVQLFESC
jgi:hypothetical protein